MEANKTIRRDLDEALTQIASLGSLMAALNTTLLAQQTPPPNAAARQPRARAPMWRT